MISFLRRNAGGLLVLLLMAAFAAAAPARAIEFANTPDKRFVAAVESALLGFRAQYRRWPKDVAELRRYADSVRRPLDLSPFIKLAIRPRTPETVYVEYATSRPARESGAFAVSFIEVGRR